MTGSKKKSRREYFESTLIRFWANVDRNGPNGCWIWMGVKGVPSHSGMVYGRFCIYSENKTVTYLAHRFSYMLAYGDIPNGQMLMHSCDVPLCVNPAHLTPGTAAENEADKMAKGRHVKGEEVHCSKITPDIVRAIRASDESNSALGRKYGVHSTHVGRIKKRQKWTHVE